MIQNQILSKQNYFLVVTFLFGFFLPLKEDYSSKVLIIVALISVIHFYRNRLFIFKKRTSSKIEFYFIIFSLLLVLYSIGSLFIHGVAEVFQINRFSFSMLLLFVSLFFYFSKKPSINFELFVFSFVYWVVYFWAY